MIQHGRYKHYRGKEYEVIDLSNISKIFDKLVYYRRSNSEKSLWIRTYNSFTADVDADGVLTPRFSFIKNKI